VVEEAEQAVAGISPMGIAAVRAVVEAQEEAEVAALFIDKH
jgi:hypothetical protein